MKAIRSMKIALISAAKKRRFKPRVKIDSGAFDFTDFAKFLRTHASEWLNSRQQPCWNREHGEHLS